MLVDSFLRQLKLRNHRYVFILLICVSIKAKPNAKSVGKKKSYPAQKHIYEYVKIQYLIETFDLLKLIQM